MNPEILFRGMGINGGWAKGNLNIITHKCDNIQPGHYISNPAGVPFAYQVRPETVGQFIGALDKYDNKMFFGDIVRRTEYKPGIYTVIWDDYRSAWWLKNIKKRENEHEDDFCQILGDGWDPERREVIGNVWDNPDMLEGKGIPIEGNTTLSKFC